MVKKICFTFITISLLTLAFAGYANAQSSGQLELSNNRVWGYGGIGNDIQGVFNLKISNPPENLAKVVFFIDDQQIGEVTQSPFTFQYNTDSYPLGLHTLHAVGYTTDGQQIESNTIQSNFVNAPSVGKIIFPILGVVLLVIVISIALPFLLNKGKLSALPLGTPRKYGIGGGTICTNCSRPFPLRFWWINLGTGKVDRCPYCGKFGMFRRYSTAELKAAEAAELRMAQPESIPTGETEAEKLQKELDNSKFQDV